MSKAIYNRQALIQYLLGSLPDEQAELFDELSITDDEFASSLEAAENDLVDAYVQGELAGSSLEKFQSAYLTSAYRRQKVDFAQSFRDFCERSAVSATPKSATQILTIMPTRWDIRTRFSDLSVFSVPRLLQLGFVSAALVFLAVGVWLAYHSFRARREISDTQAVTAPKDQNRQDAQSKLEPNRNVNASAGEESSRSRQDKQRLEQEFRTDQQSDNQNERAAKKQQRSSLGEASVASFVLTPQVRGIDQYRTVSVPGKATVVVMQLQLEPNDYLTYRVALVNESSEVLWRSHKIKAKETSAGKTLSVSFKAELLRPQTFVLQVYGVDGNRYEALSAYPFKVVK